MLVTAIAFGIFMAFNIGGNDVANSFGTSVGAGTLTMKQALVVAAIFEISGAVLAGGEVTDTVRSGIVDLGGVDLAPMDFAYIMMSALLGAALVAAGGDPSWVACIYHAFDCWWHRWCSRDHGHRYRNGWLQDDPMGRDWPYRHLLGPISDPWWHYLLFG